MDVESYDCGIGIATFSLLEPSTGSVSFASLVGTVDDVPFVFL